MGLGDQGQGQGSAGAFNPYSYLNALSPNQSLRLHPPHSQEYLNAARLQAGLVDPMALEGKNGYQKVSNKYPYIADRLTYFPRPERTLSELKLFLEHEYSLMFYYSLINP